MVSGTTSSGFAVKVDPEVIQDMEFIELAAEAQNNGLLLPKLIEMVLGEKQKKALYDHVRNKNGRVLVSAVSDEFEEILQIIREDKDTKN